MQSNDSTSSEILHIPNMNGSIAEVVVYSAAIGWSTGKIYEGKIVQRTSTPIDHCIRYQGSRGKRVMARPTVGGHAKPRAGSEVCESQDGTVPGRECSAETGVGSSLVFCKDCSRLRSQSQAFGLFVFEARMSNLTKTERMKDIQENVLT